MTTPLFYSSTASVTDITSSAPLVVLEVTGVGFKADTLLRAKLLRACGHSCNKFCQKGDICVTYMFRGFHEVCPGGSQYNTYFQNSQNLSIPNQYLHSIQDNLVTSFDPVFLTFRTIYMSMVSTRTAKFNNKNLCTACTLLVMCVIWFLKQTNVHCPKHRTDRSLWEELFPVR